MPQTVDPVFEAFNKAANAGGGSSESVANDPVFDAFNKAANPPYIDKSLHGSLPLQPGGSTAPFNPMQGGVVPSAGGAITVPPQKVPPGRPSKPSVNPVVAQRLADFNSLLQKPVAPGAAGIVGGAGIGSQVRPVKPQPIKGPLIPDPTLGLVPPQPTGRNLAQQVEAGRQANAKLEKGFNDERERNRQKAIEEPKIRAEAAKLGSYPPPPSALRTTDPTTRAALTFKNSATQAARRLAVLAGQIKAGVVGQDQIFKAKALQRQIEQYSKRLASAYEQMGDEDQAAEMKRMGWQDWVQSAVTAPLTTAEGAAFGMTPKEFQQYAPEGGRLLAGAADLATMLATGGLAAKGAGAVAGLTAGAMTAPMLAHAGVEAQDKGIGAGLQALNPLAPFSDPEASWEDKALAVLNTGLLGFGAYHGIKGLLPKAKAVEVIQTQAHVSPVEAAHIYDTAVGMAEKGAKLPEAPKAAAPEPDLGPPELRGTGQPLPGSKPALVEGKAGTAATTDPMAEFQRRVGEIKKPEAEAPKQEPSQVPTAIGNKVTDADGNVFYETRMPSEDIHVKPGLQYKVTEITNPKTGETGSLSGVNVYDEGTGGPLTVWEDKNGTRYAMNGHNRLGLAKRTGHPDLPVKVYREVDGITEDDAHVLGALQNLRDGNGNAVDAVAVLKKYGFTLDELKAKGVGLKKDVARNAIGMMDLPQEAIDMVRNRQVNEAVAGAIGEAKLPPERVLPAMKEAAKSGIDTRRQAEWLAEKLRDQKMVERSDPNDLFGDVTHEFAYGEQAKIYDRVIAKLEGSERLFGRIKKGLAAGNTYIDEAGQTHAMAIQEWGRKAFRTDPELNRILEQEALTYAENPTRDKFNTAVENVIRAAEDAADRKLGELGATKPGETRVAAEPRVGAAEGRHPGKPVLEDLTQKELENYRESVRAFEKGGSGDPKNILSPERYKEWKRLESEGNGAEYKFLTPDEFNKIYGGDVHSLADVDDMARRLNGIHTAKNARELGFELRNKLGDPEKYGPELIAADRLINEKGWDPQEVKAAAGEAHAAVNPLLPVPEDFDLTAPKEKPKVAPKPAEEPRQPVLAGEGIDIEGQMGLPGVGEAKPQSPATALRTHHEAIAGAYEKAIKSGESITLEGGGKTRTLDKSTKISVGADGELYATRNRARSTKERLSGNEADYVGQLERQLGVERPASYPYKGEPRGVAPSNDTGQRRAKPGGEFGPNGEWYEGGKWIATSEDTVKPEGKGTGKPKGEGTEAATPKAKAESDIAGRTDEQIVEQEAPKPGPDGEDAAVHVPRDYKEVLAKKGLTVTAKKLKSGKTAWAITGRTFDVKDILKEKLNAKFWSADKSWTVFDGPDPSEALVRALEEHEGGTAGERTSGDSGGTSSESRTGKRRNTGDDERIQRLREQLDASPDTRPSRDVALGEVGPDTRALIEIGLKHGIPKDVIEAQVEDVGRVLYAYKQGKPAFLITNEPGSGKTYLLGAIARELAKRGENNVTWVTQSQDLIAQARKNLADYGIGHVKFRTYSDMSKNGPGLDRGGIILFDESHNAKNIDAKAGTAAKRMIGSAKMTVFSSATPFENPAQAAFLDATGIFDEPFAKGGTGWEIPMDAHGQWARAFGADTQYIGKDKAGNPMYRLKWPSGESEGAHAARTWLEREGASSYRPMQLDPKMVESEFVKVKASQDFVDLTNKVIDAYDDAMENLGDDGESRKVGGILAMHQTNALKRILEAAKLDAGIEQAKEWLNKKDENGHPYNLVMFVETKSDRSLNTYRMSGDSNGKLYTYPEMEELMQQWEDSKIPGEKPGPPPFHPEIVKLAGAMERAGIDRKLLSVEDELVKALGGKDKVAVYTGNASQAAAAADKEAFLSGKKRVIVATMAKGGTGLSLHDTVGNRPTVQLNINLPWTATKVDQVSGRVARYGLKSKALIRWIFADNLPIEKMLADRVGKRMVDMGASVKGIDSTPGATLQDLEGMANQQSVKQMLKGEGTTPAAGKNADIKKGVSDLGQRQQNAADRFVDSAMEQFGLTKEQADAALTRLIKDKVVKLDPHSGQFNLKDGRFWEKDVLLRAAEPETKRTSTEALADAKRLFKEAKDSGSAGAMGGEKLSKIIEASTYLIEAGVRSFAEFSAELIKHFGDEIKPHLEEIFRKAGGKMPDEGEANASEVKGAETVHGDVRARSADEGQVPKQEGSQGVLGDQREGVAEQGQKEVGKEPGSHVTGLANRVQESILSEQPKKIKVRTPEEAQAHGESVLSTKSDPLGFAEGEAKQIASQSRPFSSEEFGVALAADRRFANAINEAREAGHINEMQNLQARRKAFLEDVQKGKGEWSNAGRALMAGAELDTGNFADVIQSAQDAAGARKLSDKDHAEFDRLVKEHNQAKEDLAKMRERMASDEIARKARAAKRGGDIKAIRERRKGIEADLKKIWGAGDHVLHAGPEIIYEAGSKIAKLYPHVARYVETLVEEGVVRLPEIIERIKGELPGITDTEAHDLVSGYGIEKDVRPRSEIAQEIARVRKEAGQIARESREGAVGYKFRDKGEEATAEQKKASEARAKRIADLQAKEADLREQLRTGNYEEAKARQQKQHGDYADSLERKVKRLSDTIKIKIEAQKPKSVGDRIGRFVENWQHEAILSGTSVFGHLAGASAWTALLDLVHEPFGYLAGQLKAHGTKLADIAGREGELNAKATARGMNLLFNKAGWKDAWSAIRYGRDEIGSISGKLDRDGFFGKIFARTHGATKAFLKRAQYEKSLILRTQKAARMGLNIENPNIQELIQIGAAKDGLDAALQGHNKTADWINSVIDSGKRSDSPVVKGIATAGSTLIPIKRIAFNFAKMVADYSGTGIPRGFVEHMKALKSGEITPAQADEIIRAYKRGGAGALAIYLGTSQPSWFQFKDDPDDPYTPPLELFGYEFPEVLQHHPFIEAARIWHLASKEAQKNGWGGGLKKAVGEFSWQVPGMESTHRATEALLGGQGAAKAAGQYVGSYNPQIIQQAAKGTLPGQQYTRYKGDVDSEGKTIKRESKGFVDPIQGGIPANPFGVPSRDELPPKGARSSSRSTTRQEDKREAVRK